MLDVFTSLLLNIHYMQRIGMLKRRNETITFIIFLFKLPRFPSEFRRCFGLQVCFKVSQS